MLEVPSVIFQMEALAKRVDFFSVGSNDLTQYLLAVDRNNSQVANLYDAFHPGVLRALHNIAKQSAQYLTPISLCGELASQPAGAILLLAMGFDKISMNGHNVPRIKWVIRHISFEQAQSILEKTLTLTTAKQVHSYLNEQLEALDLADFIRAGLLIYLTTQLRSGVPVKMMILTVLIACMALGSVVGFLAGLLGIGGGLIIVPALVYLLPLVGVSNEVIMPMALATSLGAIVITSSSAALAHHKKKNIPWQSC